MAVKQYQGSIQKRLVSIILLVTTLTGFFAYGSFVSWYMNDQNTKTLTLARTVALVQSQNFAKVILLNDVSVAADITSQLNSFTRLNSMVLYKKDGTPIYQYSKNDKSFSVEPLPPKAERTSKQNGNHLRLYTDADYLGNHLGYVQLNIEVNTIMDIFKRDANMLLLFYLVIILFSYFLAKFYARKFTHPILNMVTFLERIERMDSLKERIICEEDNEFGKLYDEVNTMLERINNAQQAQKIAAVAFETQSGMTITDADRNILQINKAFTDITGYALHEVIGKQASILKSGIQNRAFYDDMTQALNTYHHWNGEIYNRHKNGTIFPEHLTIQQVLDDDGKVIYYVASFLDLTIQKETEAKLQYMKQYDALTGLANKELLVERMQAHLDEEDAHGWGALICFDLKDFRLVNDAYGHTCGDGLLKQVADRLKENFGDSQLIGRIGADEFALWYTFIDKGRDKAAIEAKLLSEYLITLLSQPFKLASNSIHAMPYVGISIYEAFDIDANTLLKEADGALHMAKRDDKKIAFFDQRSEKLALLHIDMYSQLLVATEKEQLELYYQLQYNADEHAVGAEALLRWNHPKEGLISPNDFIPIAERTGLIVPMGYWVLQEACKQLAQWQNDPRTAEWVLAVNISAMQFKQDDFIVQLKSFMQAHKICYQRLKLELTETILIEDIEKTIAKMSALQKLGIQTSLDDFGTGYSSLQYLKKLPLDQVKIDQSFVKHMLENKSDVAIIKSILIMSEALNLEVIVEGVETKEQYLFLKSLGCRLFQGYYFAYPQQEKLLLATI